MPWKNDRVLQKRNELKESAKNKNINPSRRNLSKIVKAQKISIPPIRRNNKPTCKHRSTKFKAKSTIKNRRLLGRLSTVLVRGRDLRTPESKPPVRKNELANEKNISNIYYRTRSNETNPHWRALIEKRLSNRDCFEKYQEQQKGRSRRCTTWTLENWTIQWHTFVFLQRC